MLCSGGLIPDFQGNLVRSKIPLMSCITTPEVTTNSEVVAKFGSKVSKKITTDHAEPYVAPYVDLQCSAHKSKLQGKRAAMRTWSSSVRLARVLDIHAWRTELARNLSEDIHQQATMVSTQFLSPAPGGEY